MKQFRISLALALVGCMGLCATAQAQTDQFLGAPFLKSTLATSHSPSSHSPSSHSPSSHTASASRAPQPEPVVAPMSNFSRNYFGFDLGITSSAYYGQSNFFWPIFNAPNREFSYEQFDGLGSGIGFLFGGKVGIALSDVVGLEAKLRYQTNSTSQTETHTFPEGASAATFPATNSYTLTLTNLNLLALAHVNLSNALYLIGGVGINSMLGNHYTGSQVLHGGVYTDRGTGLATTDSTLSADNTNVDSTFNKTHPELHIGVGTVFPLGTGGTLLDAELMLSFPLGQLLQSSYVDVLNTYGSSVQSPALPAVTSPTLLYATLTIGIHFPFGGYAAAEPASYEPTNEQTDEPTTTTTITPDAEGKVPLTGRVTDKNGNPVDATMTTVDLTTNEVVSTDKTDNNGNYRVRVKAPGKYSVTADANGYLFGTSYFEVDPQGRILAQHPNIQLADATTGRTRLLVFFDFDKSDLKSSSYPELNRAVRLMKAVPTMQVEIAGYTDSKGTPEYNKDLSQRRANAVKDYLVRNGIGKNRISAQGYGEDSPIATNDTDEGRAENRRVEFVVLSR